MNGGCFAFLTLATAWATGFAAWVSAIVHCAQSDMIAMLIIDILIPPVGVVHGIILWLT